MEAFNCTYIIAQLEELRKNMFEFALNITLNNNRSKKCSLMVNKSVYKKKFLKGSCKKYIPVLETIEETPEDELIVCYQDNTIKNCQKSKKNTKKRNKDNKKRVKGNLLNKKINNNTCEEDDFDEKCVRTIKLDGYDTRNKAKLLDFWKNIDLTLWLDESDLNNSDYDY